MRESLEDDYESESRQEPLAPTAMLSMEQRLREDALDFKRTDYFIMGWMSHFVSKLSICPCADRRSPSRPKCPCCLKMHDVLKRIRSSKNDP